MTLFPSLLRNQNLCILLARYPECLLSRASSRKAGVCVCVCVCVCVYVRMSVCVQKKTLCQLPIAPPEGWSSAQSILACGSSLRSLCAHLAMQVSHLHQSGSGSSGSSGPCRRRLHLSLSDCILSPRPESVTCTATCRLTPRPLTTCTCCPFAVPPPTCIFGSLCGQLTSVLLPEPTCWHPPDAAPSCAHVRARARACV